MQKMQNPDIEGEGYQRGTLYQYEVREYLLEKWCRTCMYCGAKDRTLEVEHLVPKSKGGSNRISNLGIACRPCNQAKGSKDLEEFLAKKPEVLKKIRTQLKKPLNDAAAVNATRNYLFEQLLKTGLPVLTGSGSQTKYNRTRFGIHKTHALDAACVGDIDGVVVKSYYHQIVHCTGRGKYQRTLSNKYGFTRAKLTRVKRQFGFATGDLVRHVVLTRGEYVHTVGRMAVRASGYFSLQPNIPDTRPMSVNYRSCKVIHMADGYKYNHSPYVFMRQHNGLPGSVAGYPLK
jgi:hypothetical protein